MLQRSNKFLKSPFQQGIWQLTSKQSLIIMYNLHVIYDVINYGLCCGLFNELFTKIILLLLVLWVRYHMKTKCAFKRYIKLVLDTKLLLQTILQKCLRPK